MAKNNFLTLDEIAEPAAPSMLSLDEAVGEPVKQDRSFLGASLESGVRAVAAAGARIVDELNPFTLSESDAAALYKDQPEKLQELLKNHASFTLSRFANEQTRRAKEAMQEVSPADTGAVSGKPLTDLEYATLDPSKAAYLSPTRVAGDVLGSLPTTIALGVAAYLTRGRSAQASARAEADALARGATAEEAKAAARAAAIKEGAQTMATTSAVGEGAAGYAIQRNQAFDEAINLPEEVFQKSPQYQALLEEGYSPEAARLRLSAGTAQESGLLAGAVNVGTNLVGGRVLGRVIGEGGSLLPRTLKGFGTEAATETVQSGGEQLMGNLAMRNIQPGQSLTEGVGEAMAAGAVVGGVTGGGVAALLGSRQRTPTPQQQPAPPDLPSLDQQLGTAVDELTTTVDPYVGITNAATVDDAIAAAGQATAVSLDQPAAPMSLPEQQAMVDRNAELLAQAEAAPTTFDRQNALDQAQTALPTPRASAAEGFADLTPMDERQATNRLTVLRDMTAREGGDALELAIVPHPTQAGRFAIGKQALPDLTIDTAPAPVSDAQVQNRLESAALTGTIGQRRLEDMPRQVVIDNALRNVEARGGVASPAEARIFQEAGIGQPYDRIDPNLAPPLTVDERLTQATGIPLVSTPRSAMTQQTGPTDQQLQQTENQARSDSRMEQLARDRAAAQVQPQVPGQPAAPAANEVISAMVVPGRERSAEQVAVINQAQNRYDPVDFSILQRAAMAPFQLSQEERLRLRDLRNQPAPAAPAAPAVQPTTQTAPGVAPTQQVGVNTETGLLGTRVAERLGQPTAGRIITSGAKLSTQRNPAPGVTVTVNDGQTQHSATVVDPGRLGNTGRLLTQVSRIFGKRLVVFESDSLAADGFVLDDDNQSIYVNAKSQISPLAVFGHEMTHLLKRDNAEAYTALEAVVQRNLAPQGMEQFTAEYGADANLEELTSDLVGNRFQEADFWTDVFNEVAAQNPENARGIVTRMAAALQKAVNAFLRVVRQPGFQADQYVQNLESIKAAVRQAVTTYAQTQRQSAMQLEAELARQESAVDLTAGSRMGDNDSNANIGARNARFSDARGDQGERRPAGQDGQEPGVAGRDQAPSYGQAREGAVQVLGRHYSKGPRQALSGQYYGTGLKGAELERLTQSNDLRLRQRVYFYVDEGAGIRPEAGVGGYAHEVQLNNIYDPASRLIAPQPDANAFESAVIDAGFDGYKAPFGTNQAAVVLLGPKHKAVPVRAIGQVASAPAPQAAEPTTLKKGLMSRELNSIDTSRIPGARVSMGNLEVPVESRDAANAELERIGSPARFSRRREVPEAIDNLARLEQVFPRARDGAFNTNRELKVSLQDAILAAAAEARVDLAAQTPEIEKYLVRVGVADALYAIESNANAVGWYDKTVTKAMRILGKLHPEINTDPNAKFAFTWALAVTSNGLKVDKNFELAERAYKDYKRTGRMPTNIQAGKAQEAINKSLNLFNLMVDQYGVDNVRRFMDSKFRVSQIKRATGLTVTGENADTEVRGAAVLGPKIGNGFFSNLNGFFDQLTMDRWLMRTWGRWTGTLIEERPDMVRAKRQELRTLVAEMKKNAPAAAEFQKALGRKLTVGDPDDLALAIQKASQDPETREKFNATVVGENLRKTGNSLAGYLDGQKEAPDNGDQRNYIRKVFTQILDEVRTRGFPSLTMSDLQALLWYPEKRLYDTAKSTEDEAEGYADDEAPDYANAAAKLARANGVSNKDIQQAIREAEKDYETRERAGAAERSAGDSQADARPEGGVRGFGEREKRDFLTTGIIHRIRSDRSGDAGESGPYTRKGGGDGKGLRVLGQPSVAVFSPAPKFKNALAEIPAAAPKFFELDERGAALFQDAIQSSKDASPFGAAVYVYPLEDYQGMRLFLTQDAKAGFALKGDDIVSVFAGPEQRGAANAIMQLAVQEGGRRLDAFNTVLPKLYGVHGFKTVARTLWNDDYAPDGWNKSTFQAFNNGEPDVVFMAYDPEYFDVPRNTDGEVIENYDDGAVKQREALGGQAPRATLSRQRQAQSEYDAIVAQYKDTDQWLKAPNGKDTNLTERQWVQVRTPSFKAWFGDWEKYANGTDGNGVWSAPEGAVSKVVDDNGEPLVVYHGTNKAGFSEFEEPGGTKRGDLGIFTTPNREMARTYMSRRGSEVALPVPQSIDDLTELGLEIVDNGDGGFGVYGSDGYLNGTYDSEEEIVQIYSRAPLPSRDEAGFYASFLNIRNPLEENFEGANWDGSRSGQYQVVNDEGEVQYNDNGRGYFNDRDEAEALAESTGGEVQPADDFYQNTDSAVREARRYNDGAIIRQVVDSGPGVYSSYIDEPSDVFVAFKPNQLKSATQNTGEFSERSDDMRFSRRRNIFGHAAPLANWTTPTETKFDDFIYVMQDKMVDTKRVVDAIKGAVKKIDDQWNPYLQEELYHGRTAKQTKDFLGDELRPLLQEMQARGVKVADFEEYLHNRHAEERNRQIAKVNPNMPDGGSGIDTADARTYLANLTQQQRRDYEQLAKRVDAITANTRKLLIDSGMETPETIKAWETAYGSYVPLQREDLDFSSQFTGMGTGQGFSVRGSSSKRATGSKRDVVDILANIAIQRERAIVRAQKSEVARAVYGLAVQNPNTDFWLAVDPEGQKDPNRAMADLMAMGINPIDAKNIIEEPKQTFVDPRTGLVSQRVNPTLRNSPNVLAVRIDGQEKYVFFNASDERSQRMATALKNLDADQLGRVMGIAAQITRYFASVNTQYNPIFGAINFLRDVQTAGLQLSTTPIADRKAQVLADTIPALRGIYGDVRAERKGRSKPTGTWATLWEEFQREGGQTGYRDQFSKSAERAEALERELKRISEGKAMQFGRAIFDWLSDYNETMENAVRLAAYKAAKDKGLSIPQAASIAKNLTVNFNRKGQVATQAGALYAFFNASVQGTARLAQTLAGPAGRKIVAGGLLLGTAQAMLLAAAGYDEDEPPEFVRERNLIIPLPNGKYLTVPMPLGFNVIPNTSRVLTEYALSGWRDPAKRVGQITGAFLEMFNPIGNAGWSVQTIAPTIADPLVALSENRDYTGKKIAKEDMSSLNPTPGYTRAKETASWFSKQLAYYLNLASGGTKYKQGLISPTPDQIDYLIGQATGGVGRELLKAEQTVTSTATGEELPPYKVPLLGRFYGDTKSSAAESGRFYENITRLNEHENEIKGRRDNRENVTEYRRENPEARLVPFANQIERDVQKLRQRKRDLLERGASKESIKIVETQITNKMKRLNDRVRQLREQETAQ